MNKTFEQILDEVAINHGYNNWDELVYLSNKNDKPMPIFSLCKEAAILYGESKFNEGAEEQKEMTINSLALYSGVWVYPADYKKMQDWMNNTPKPTFKP